MKSQCNIVTFSRIFIWFSVISMILHNPDEDNLFKESTAAPVILLTVCLLVGALPGNADESWLKHLRITRKVRTRNPAYTKFRENDVFSFLRYELTFEFKQRWSRLMAKSVPTPSTLPVWSSVSRLCHYAAWQVERCTYAYSVRTLTVTSFINRRTHVWFNFGMTF